VTFGISGNLDKDELPQVVEHMLDRFDRSKTEYVIHDTLAKFVKPYLHSRSIPRSYLVKEEAFAKTCDMLVSLGGDGTILRFARLLAGTKIPILGINLGKLGFLAEVPLDEMDKCFDEILRGEYSIETRMMLESKGNGMKLPFTALNDIVVSKFGASRVMDIEAHVNNDFLGTFTGDGIIISTPTGSTAYALANGGPIVTPANHSITISPICPHTLTARPVIVPDDSVIVLKVSSKVARIQLSADGQLERQLPSPATVTVNKAPFAARLVKRKNTSYYELLRKKLHWARDGRISSRRGA
jgi:NAD+ kinase